MESLFERNYEAQKKRGLITSKTELVEFLLKLEEEVKEVNISYDSEAGYIDPSELVDVMLVCASTLIFMGKNPIEEIKKKVVINEGIGEIAELKI